MAKKRKNAFTIDFYGSSELLKKVEAAGGNVEKAISQAVSRSMAAPKRDMQSFIASHHLTGRTEESFGETPIEWKNGVLEYATGFNLKKGGEGALFLDIGSPTIAPTFWVSNLVDKHISNIREAQQAALREILKELIE